MMKKSFSKILCLSVLQLAMIPMGLASDESFPILKEAQLRDKLIQGTTTLRKAFDVQKQKPDSQVTVNGEYYSWLSQCLEQIAQSEKSALWTHCLNFSAQMLRMEESGETASMLAPAYKSHPKKWDSTLKALSKEDSSFLTLELKAALDLEEPAPTPKKEIKKTNETKKKDGTKKTKTSTK